MERQSLFAGTSIDRQQAAQMEGLARSIAHLSVSDLQVENEEQTVAKLQARHDLQAPSLDEDGITVTEGKLEVQLNAHEAFVRDLDTGTTVEVEAAFFHVPFDGDGRMFALKPSRYSVTPQAEIREKELVFAIPLRGQDAAVTKQTLEEMMLEPTRHHLKILKEDCDKFNVRLDSEIRQRIAERRQAEAQKKAYFGDLGFPKKP